MKSAKIYITLIVLLVSALKVSAQKSKDQNVKPAAKERSEILEQIFDDGFEKLINDKNFAQCLVPIINNEKIILIETPESKILPQSVGRYRFKFLNEKGIEPEIKTNDGDCYFKLNGFQAMSSKGVKVILWRWIEVVTVVEGKSWYPARLTSAGGLVYEALKTDNKRNVKFLNDVWAVS